MKKLKNIGCEKKIIDVLKRVKRCLKEIYGHKLIDVILYGSYARNSYDDDSDIDIAVVLKGSVDKTKEIDIIYDSLYDLILEYSELISIFPLSEDDLENTSWPLYYNIINEGIKI
jgi:predicted nucleotidyltransferase